MGNLLYLPQVKAQYELYVPLPEPFGNDVSLRSTFKMREMTEVMRQREEKTIELEFIEFIELVNNVSVGDLLQIHFKPLESRYIT